MKVKMECENGQDGGETKKKNKSTCEKHVTLRVSTNVDDYMEHVNHNIS